MHVFSSYDTEEQLLRVAVIDNGCGIQAKDMQNLFKHFGKLKRTEHINKEGIGMGLLICKRLIEANSGEIEIHSDGPNMGCIVRFTLPMIIPTAEDLKLQN